MKEINNHHLEKLLRKVLGDVLCGVWASDQLPSLTRSFALPSYFIISTHEGHQPWEHWLSITLEEDGTGTLFYSYGFSPDFDYYPGSILHFLENHSDRILYHKLQLQHPLSRVCSQHCIYYLYHRFCGLSFEQVLSLYDRDVVKNDLESCAAVKKFQSCTSSNKNNSSCGVQDACSLETYLNQC